MNTFEDETACNIIMVLTQHGGEITKETLNNFLELCYNFLSI